MQVKTSFDNMISKPIKRLPKSR